MTHCRLLFFAPIARGHFGDCQVKDGTLWIAFPTHHRCKELFSEHCVIGVDESDLKYEDHSGAWRRNVDGLEPTDDASFFAWLSFVTEPARGVGGEDDEHSECGSDDSDSSGLEY